MCPRDTRPLIYIRSSAALLVRDEPAIKLRGLGVAGIGAHETRRARRLEERLPDLKRLDGAAAELRADFALGPGRLHPSAPACRSVLTAYVTKGEIRPQQLGGGAVEMFQVGQSFFEPPGATHLVSANASNTEPAELIAVFVADEGAQLTTFID